MQMPAHRSAANLSCEGETRHPVGSKALPEGAIEDAKTVDLTYAGWMVLGFHRKGLMVRPASRGQSNMCLPARSTA